MRRSIVAAVILVLLGLCPASAADDALHCRSIPLLDIEWVASFNDDMNPDTPGNHAVIVQGTDGSGEYYGMEWNSPEFTDLSLNALDHSDRTGTNAITLKLSATEAMDVVVVVSVRGDYCGDTWRYAASEPIRVGTIAQDFELPSSAFSDNPFGSCTGQLSEDALEDICSIFLLPSPTAGELRIYEVALCGDAPEEVAVEMPIDEPPPTAEETETPVFTVDSDVTLASVVQIGDGPQELSTAIKFYPNTRRAKPGDTVYWTLDLGDLEGPFTISPEMNNDARREPSISSAESTITLEYVYRVGAIYVPYVLIRDGDGTERTIYTTNVLGVLPELAPRERIGIDIPTAEDPVGDYIKGVQVCGFEETLLDSESGRSYVKSQIKRWASAGVNFVMYNPMLFVENINANVTLPLYGEVWPDSAVPSMTFDWMIALADWSHEIGMRVGFRTFMVAMRDYDVGGRTSFNPTSEGLYFDYHVQIKTMYAEIAEALGVEMFCLDAENPVTSLSSESLRVLEGVRSVYTGIVTDSPTTDLFIAFSSPLWEELDLIYFSYNSNLINMAGASRERIETVLQADIDYRILPLLEYWQKPGLLESFVQYSQSYPSHQRKGYEAQLEALATAGSLLMGVTFWDAVLNPNDPVPHSPFGRTSEATISEYFHNILPDHTEYSFGESEVVPTPHFYIDRFESNIEQGYFDDIWTHGGTVNFSSGAQAKGGDASLRVDFNCTTREHELSYGFFFWEFDSPMDWGQFESLNFWYRSDGSPSDIQMNIFDSDGQRYVVHADNRSYRPGWVLISVCLEHFGQPAWMGSAQEGIDWKRIIKFGIAELKFDGLDHTTYFDEIFLSRDAIAD